jgi:hypothetical protein
MARWIGFALLAVAVLLTGTWCALAVWFRYSGGEVFRGALAAIIVVLALAAVASLVTSRRQLAFTVYIVLIALVFAWWSTIHPSNDRDWQPDVARNVTATIDNNRVVVDNVRNFNWRSDQDFDQRWEQRTYDLAQLHDVDLILSYWSGEAIAHLIVSFGFDDGQRLDFSIETRKERGEEYSTIAGFFKQYELVIIAADERDIVRVRSNIRGEDVRIYRLRMPPKYARQLLEEYLNVTPPPATARRSCLGWFIRCVRDCHSTTAFSYPAFCPIMLMMSEQLIRACPLRDFGHSHESTTKRCRLMAILITQG